MNDVTMGIDPGLARCGYAVFSGQDLVTYGVITTAATSTLGARLSELRSDLLLLLNTYHPTAAAVEMAPGAISGGRARGLALALQARGVIVEASHKAGLPHVWNVAPHVWKAHLPGCSGQAGKPQVRAILGRILDTHVAGVDDSVDAIGIAWWGAAKLARGDI